MARKSKFLARSVQEKLIELKSNKQDDPINIAL